MSFDDFKEFDINWNNYGEKLTELYTFYINNIHNKLYFMNKIVICREKPEFDGKVECFWYIITEGLQHNKKNSERIPDIERCKRIALIPIMLENYNDLRIKCWEKLEHTTKGKQNRIYIWLPEYKYIVILGKNKNNFQLITAYYTNYEHTERKLKKESSMYEDPRKSGGRL